jgi:ribosomal protein S18 acetylase RimI-like enzyme
MAAYESLSRQFVDSRGKEHTITASGFGDVEARSGKTVTGRLGVMLDFQRTKDRPHMVFGIATHKRYERRGIASAMFNLAEEHYGPIDIGPTSSDAGANWKKKMGQ